MAKLERYVPKERPEIQDNIYFGKIMSVDLKVWSPESKTLNWKFELSQPPYIGQTVWVWGTTGVAPTPKAKLTTWGATLGYSREQLSDPTFDTEVFVGSYVKITLKTWQKENGEMKQGVTDINPLNEADTQMLQMWLQQAQVTGPAKVAVQASPVQQVLAPAPAAQSVNPVPVINQPVLPVQPVVSIPVIAPVTAPRRRSEMPF